MEYSVFSTEIESPDTNFLATCRELGVAIVAYSPLSRGLLGGALQSPDDFGEGDIRRFYPRFSRENFPKNMELVEAIRELSKSKGCTVGQVGLAWLLAQGDDIFPIPGYVNGRTSLSSRLLKMLIVSQDHHTRLYRRELQRHAR